MHPSVPGHQVYSRAVGHCAVHSGALEMAPNIFNLKNITSAVDGVVICLGRSPAYLPPPHQPHQVPHLLLNSQS